MTRNSTLKAHQRRLFKRENPTPAERRKAPFTACHRLILRSTNKVDYRKPNERLAVIYTKLLQPCQFSHLSYTGLICTR